MPDTGGLTFEKISSHYSETKQEAQDERGCGHPLIDVTIRYDPRLPLGEYRDIFNNPPRWKMAKHQSQSPRYLRELM